MLSEADALEMVRGLVGHTDIRPAATIALRMVLAGYDRLAAQNVQMCEALGRLIGHTTPGKYRHGLYPYRWQWCETTYNRATETACGNCPGCLAYDAAQVALKAAENVNDAQTIS